MLQNESVSFEPGMKAPPPFQDNPVLFRASIPPDVGEAEYTWEENDGRVVRTESLLLVLLDPSVMVVEIDGDGNAVEDTWFETAEEAFAIYNDVKWEQVAADSN
jgi:hypothetical protein